VSGSSFDAFSSREPVPTSLENATSESDTARAPGSLVRRVVSFSNRGTSGRQPHPPRLEGLVQATFVAGSARHNGNKPLPRNDHGGTAVPSEPDALPKGYIQLTFNQGDLYDQPKPEPGPAEPEPR